MSRRFCSGARIKGNIKIKLKESFLSAQKVKVPFPKSGEDPKDVIAKLKSFKQNDYKWELGKVFCLTYPVDDSHHEFLKESYGEYISENFLNPMAFESLKKMEREVVRMTIDLLNGDDECVGTMTSGGTESILMAVKAARDLARKTRPWILKPEVVAPKSTHVAFEKACKYFGLKYVTVELDDDYRVNLKALKKAVNKSCVLIVASAPQYPQGIIDPIEEVGQLALKKKIPFHVDACVGGFMLPWLEELGADIPPFDFRVPGVTSISADIHKYGYAAKGASVIMYRNMKYMKHQFFITATWPGGVYASPNFPGTRPGGAIAAAWATIKKFGKEGYKEQAKFSLQATEKFKAGVKEIEGLKICGDPKGTIISFESSLEELSIYVVADLMSEKGWFFDRMQEPPAIHLTVMPIHCGKEDEFLNDLRQSVETALANPEMAKSGNAAMYGMMAKIPMKGLVKKSVESIMESMWGPLGQTPDLENAGKDKNASFIMKMADQYGPKALDVYGAVEKKTRSLMDKTSKLNIFKDKK